MNVYMAGVFSTGYTRESKQYLRMSQKDRDNLASIKFHLESYHYIGKQGQVNRIREEGKPIFLDSGAFSAFTKGIKVDIDAYCDYVKRNDDIIENIDGIKMFSVLDGIGDPQLTYENQCYMEAKGVRPLPCFHYGEDERYLEHYIANYEYITLGGMVPISTKQLDFWLDRIWEDHLTDGAGHPRVRVHGFGLTSIPLMRDYPWFSVDSSTWLMWAIYGQVLCMPDAVSLYVSWATRTRKIEGMHIDNLSEFEQRKMVDLLTKGGLDVEEAHENSHTRAAFNAKMFTWLGEASAQIVPTYHAKQPRLF